jgi:uncharacterized protein
LFGGKIKMSTNRLLKARTALLLMVLLVFVISGCAAAPSAATGQDSSLRNTISVSGTGEASGRPDIATVQLGVNVIDDDLGAALDESNVLVEAITSAMLSIGIAEEDLRTTNFNVWPEDLYDPRSGERTDERKFHVDSTLEIKIRDIDSSGDVIHEGLNAGANNIYGLTFGIDDPGDLEAEARSAAFEDARQRAAQLADEMGVTLGDPIIVSEGFSGGGFNTGFARAESGGGGPPISLGQLSVSIQVNVTFEALP